MMLLLLLLCVAVVVEGEISLRQEEHKFNLKAGKVSLNLKADEPFHPRSVIRVSIKFWPIL